MDIEALQSPEPGNEYLIHRIQERIKVEGRITFAEFMEMALYDPEYGYYTSGREPVGESGDYLTSPMMHPAFGAAIAKWLFAKWCDMGKPSQFDVVEIGAGKGLLCATILTWMQREFPELFQAVDYLIVERGSLRSDRALNLPDMQGKVRVLEDVSEIPDGSINGCIFSNELVDAFPVHLVTVEGGRLQEIFVELCDHRFVEIFGEPSTPDIPEYFARLGILLPEEYRTEVNLHALDWIKQIGSKHASGYILTIDYGYAADEYYMPGRRRGTLMCYYRHMFSEDPYVRIGMQDITAHVDFTSLMNAEVESGIVVESFKTQRDFLIDLGFYDLMDRLEGRRAAMSLIDPRGMGSFKALVQKRI